MTNQPPGEDAGFEQYRDYLLLLSRMGVDRRLRSKVGASDLVQQTLMEAHQAKANFTARDAGATLAWLKQILARNIMNAARDFNRAKRDVGREQPLEKPGATESSPMLADWLAADQSSPSLEMRRREQAMRLLAALEGLPPNQREAVSLRHLECLPLAEIAAKMETTTAAVTGLLHRGMKGLRKNLDQLE